MTNALLVAVSQPALEGSVAPVERRLRVPPRPVLKSARALPPQEAVTDAGAERLEFARRLAAVFEPVEALVVGADVRSCPGLNDGDVVFVDWSTRGATLTARRQETGEIALDVSEGDCTGAAGAVFAVMRSEVA